MNTEVPTMKDLEDVQLLLRARNTKSSPARLRYTSVRTWSHDGSWFRSMWWTVEVYVTGPTGEIDNLLNATSDRFDTRTNTEPITLKKLVSCIKGNTLTIAVGGGHFETEHLEYLVQTWKAWPFNFGLESWHPIHLDSREFPTAAVVIPPVTEKGKDGIVVIKDVGENN